ncbi:hypothetical protein [Formosa haliotis]|uniref:hypothetical protein n=1 Tax=Formosa haliotis TaxID=1555194 RepID=UPI000826D38A|nr:hypothetical protein [Formosa haliotis]
MKTFLSIALGLLLSGGLYAQTTKFSKAKGKRIAETTIEAPDAAIVGSASSTTAVKTTGVNANYLNISNVLESPKSVRQFQQIVAEYDVKTSGMYNSKYEGLSKPIYQITMQTKDGILRVDYNGDGKIVKTSEHYSNVAIPSFMVVKILQEYPGWKIVSQNCNVDYLQNKGTTRTYKIKIEKEGKKKTLHLDGAGKLL